MKKWGMICIVLLMFSGVTQAQGWSFDGGSDYRRNVFGVDFGVGALTQTEGAQVSLGLRYLHNFCEYVGWDVIGVQGMGNTKEFDSSFMLQGMTGIRGTTPAFYNDLSMYANFRAGYGYCIDAEAGGFCYELGVGINLTENIYVGYGYDFQSLDDSGYSLHLNYHAFRFGFNF